MNRLDLEEIINKAAKEAVKEFNKEKLIEQKKRVFHNTRLLLKHYNELKDHIEHAVDDINKLDSHMLIESDFIDMEKETDELYIMSIKRSKTKTLIMVSHIDTALERLRKKQIESGTIERYEALIMFYINRMTYEDIQEKFQCSKNTPGRWINQMTNELSVYLFGIDGLKLDMVQ